jgi:hypothetical protein
MDPAALDGQAPVDTDAPVRDDVVADVRDALAQSRGEAPPAPDATTETAAETAARVRDEQGRFAKAEADKATAAPIPDQDTTKASETAPSTAQNAPPVSWSAEAKAEWAKLPPAIQTAVLKRETEASDGFRQKSEEIKRYESVIQPAAQRAQQLGVGPDQFITNMIATEQALNRDPAGSIRWLAQQYGVDLSTLSQAPDPQQPATAPQQVLAPVYDEIQQVRSQVDQISRIHAEASIQDFARNPEHKFFPEVKTEMGRLLQTGVANTMDDAYRIAVAANPDIQAKVIESAVAEREEKRKADIAAKAKSAGAAAVSIRAPGYGNGAAPPRGSNGSAFDDVRAAIEQSRGSV